LGLRGFTFPLGVCLSLGSGSFLLGSLGGSSDLSVGLESLGGSVVNDGVVVLLDNFDGFGLDRFGGCK